LCYYIMTKCICKKCLYLSGNSARSNYFWSCIHAKLIYISSTNLSVLLVMILVYTCDDFPNRLFYALSVAYTNCKTATIQNTLRNACNSLEHTARSPTPMAYSENGALELCVGQGYVKMTRGFIRGGNWNNGTNAGAFALNLNNTPTDTNTNIGFRVARSLRLVLGLPGTKRRSARHATAASSVHRKVSSLSLSWLGFEPNTYWRCVGILLSSRRWASCAA